MIRNCFIFGIILTIVFSSYVCASAKDGFETEKSAHFIIRYRCDKQFARQIIKYSELYYDKIESDLGLNRYSNFWTWNNRCVIVIFADKSEYHLATNQPEWFAGSADYTNRTIYTYPSSATFMDSLLPHELTHIIFREYIKDNAGVPLWIDEGIAQYEEKYSDPQRHTLLAKSVRNKTHIPFSEFSRINNVISNKDNIFVTLFYEQSKNIINFLITNYGQQRFGEFIRQLKAGKNVDSALKFSYPGIIENMNQLEIKWLNSFSK